MMVDSIHTIRKLTALLVVSGSCNIIFMISFFYWIMSERPPVAYFELKPAERQEEQAPLAIDQSDSEVIRYFRRMPLPWLISRLGNTQLVENGYTQRDLALASLVAFHDFDLDRAFSTLSFPKQKRLIVYGKFRDGRSAELLVYPGLSDKHFEAIQRFAATERWPLTSRGLFLALQKEEKADYDPSLLDAFFMTAQFSSVETLFNRGDFPAEKEELLQVVLEGSWDSLSVFAEQQKISQDLSEAHRRHFLLKYVQNKSKAAAQLMLKIDGMFAARKLDDTQVLMLLELIDEKTVQAEHFISMLLKSPRSDAVLKAAADRIYSYNGGLAIEDGDRVLSESKHRLNPHSLAKVDPRIVNEAKALDSNPIKISLKDTSLNQKTSGSVTPAAVTNTQKTLDQRNSMRPKLMESREIGKFPQKNEKKNLVYTVQEGDSLWRIARRFSVDIERLKGVNQLESDALKPGQILKIPSGS